MPKKNILTQQQAVDYLRNVMKEWSAFLDAHNPFKQALEIILAECKPQHQVTVNSEGLDWLKLARQQQYITAQQYKTLKGQVEHGDTDAAMRGLAKILNRRSKI